MEAARATWTVHTEVFDGPLDLLLHLVRRDGIEVSRLSMVAICDSYLEYLERMRELRLEIAADYLVMAATLLWLKSLDLLPRQPTALDPEEEGEDPRDALARRLEEYARYREAADALDERPRLDRDVFAREPEEIDGGQRPLVAGVEAFALLDLYWEMLRREPAVEPVHAVGESGPDIESCCRHVLDVLTAGGGRGELGRILQGIGRRLDRVLTFLATLEMARLGWVALAQDEHLGPVRMELRSGVTPDLTVLAGRMLSGEAG